MNLIFYQNKFILFNFLGKNRLYPAYSLSSSEPEETNSPLHRNIYNNPYTPTHYHSRHYNSVTKYKPTSGLSDTPQSSCHNSDNISEDATLTDTETALARENTLLHNGK